MAVVCTERYFASECGEANVRYLTWKDDNKTPQGIYLIAHGVCEHIDRYDEFAEFLVEKGFIVYGEDHLGHGKTAGPIENIGQMPLDADKYIVEDMNVLYNISITENPGIPVFMLGHSMGSFVAKMYSMKYGKQLKGIIYCGTGSYPNILRYIIPPAKALINFVGPEKRFLVKGNMLSISWISVDKDNRREYLKDEYITKYYSLGLLRDLGMLATNCSKHGWDRTIPSNLPILIISGTADIVGFCKHGVDKTEKDLLESGHTNVKKIYYKGMRHEILREAGSKDKAFNDIYEWTMKNFD